MKKLLISKIIFCIALILLIFSGTNMVLWHLDNKNLETKINLVQNITPIKVITPENDESNESYLSADLSEVIKLNSDAIAWLNVPYTSINYPILQTTDNSYYLTHSFDKKKNKAGWIFMDYRNNRKMTDKNTVIYGHNRLDGSMFGSLNNLTKKDYLNNNEHLIYISTEEYNYVYEIFSIYHINNTDDYITSNFENNEYSSWLKLIQNRSIYDFNIKLNETDKVLTLTTCYQHIKKTVVHAKLIRMQVSEN